MVFPKGSIRALPKLILKVSQPKPEEISPHVVEQQAQKAKLVIEEPKENRIGSTETGSSSRAPRLRLHVRKPVGSGSRPEKPTPIESQKDQDNFAEELVSVFPSLFKTLFSP